MLATWLDMSARMKALRLSATTVLRVGTTAGMGHKLSNDYLGRNSNLATAYPSAADLPERLRSTHAQCPWLRFAASSFRSRS